MPRFVNYYLASSRFRKQFIIKAKTTAFTTIGQDDIASCAGYFPRCPEQQKIADFLSSIDAIIDNYNNTIKVWEKRKKGIMQKLFSQKVRFKADDGSDFPDWKKKNWEMCLRFQQKLMKIDTENRMFYLCQRNTVLLIKLNFWVGALLEMIFQTIKL